MGAFATCVDPLPSTLPHPVPHPYSLPLNHSPNTSQSVHRGPAGARRAAEGCAVAAREMRPGSWAGPGAGLQPVSIGVHHLQGCGAHLLREFSGLGGGEPESRGAEPGKESEDEKLLEGKVRPGCRAAESAGPR